ncbi:antitoxin YefM [Anaerovibrio lipolyticus DSM 3074]|jgi:antitoxin YefM|uniref:Prevent-host-death family protein n=2 Tax=Anaerovibrio lipolyticus TaxID=82374 RepID=A0A0B2JP48_9FIRM|nr:prevent-host-death family protein [Anaerovibrio lipolyticus]KHM47677.1 prevent-host-death family protein [Anaerovibrio lipolyticus]MBO5588211.1 type II toxin-antitoxin system Phd/YefM family antitoxin [Anaerovibrio sp.]MBQ1856015.1 type II toxin-antitoxin system Phd/YefM family antitoxin [Anaerovibrio sp.]SHI41601.1 antitoxin YefM [Anaerovibrio lipolyticus DSM 3074]
MIAVPSSDFLKEFTIYADKATDEKETIFVQRSNDKNLVVMSMDAYNEIQKKLYETQK